MKKVFVFLAVGLAVAAMVLPTAAQTKRPNILVIWGDDIGYWNISAYNQGMMGYRTPNIDRIANEGMLFTDAYGEQSCTAGRAAFVTGQIPFRTGLTKVGLPGSDLGLKPQDPTIAELLKPHGYMTGQFGKNHLGDRDEHLPSAVQDVVSSFEPSTTGNLRIIADFPGHTTQRPLKIRIEHGEGLTAKGEQIERLRIEISERLRGLLNFAPAVEMVPPNTFEKPGIHKVPLIVRDGGGG